SHIVRGEDLLDSTPRQLYLQQCLGYNQPTYSHLPLVLNGHGQKLSKQNLAAGLRAGNESRNLWQALRWLQQSPPEPLQWQTVSEILTWAINHWDSHTLAKNPQNALVPEGY
ncbi:MAG: glutamate--tRNA ligase family protein, partial [Porticoccaceae bacterium]